MRFDEHNVLTNVEVKDKDDLLKLISKEATENGISKDAEKLDKSFEEREEEYSTGLEDGFAIPHAKTDAVKEVGIIYARLKNPIAWKTYDNKPVSDVFALMVPPENAGTTHLKMLAKLSTALLEDDFKKELRSLNDPQKLAEFISKEIEVKEL